MIRNVASAAILVLAVTLMLTLVTVARAEPLIYFATETRNPTPYGGVIPGMREGVIGMRVGGQRRLYIPPELAYGDKGAGNVIGPDEVLVFEVELLDLP